MKKWSLLCFGAFLMLFACENVPVEKPVYVVLNEAFSMGLQGNVTKMSEKYWEVSDSLKDLQLIIAQNPMREMRWEFNVAGQKLSYNEWKLGRREQQIVYQHDENGLLQHWHSTDAMERKDKTYECVYNEKGQLSQTQTFNMKGELIANATYTYDDKDRLYKQIEKSFRTDGDGERIEEKTETIWNNWLLLDKKLLKIATKRNDTLVAEAFFEEGKRIDYRTFYPDGNLKMVITYPDGKKIVGIRTEYRDQDRNVYAYKNEVLNEKGLVISAIQITDPEKIFSWEKFEYDQNGNMVLRKQAFGIEISADSFQSADTLHPSIEQFEYQYGPHGNWIQKLSFVDDSLSSVVVRDFEFFPKQDSDSTKTQQ